MADFIVYLVPTKVEENANETPEPIEFLNVDLGFNQMGWLVFTHTETREPIAVFVPGSVRYVERAMRDEIVTEIEAKELVN